MRKTLYCLLSAARTPNHPGKEEDMQDLPKYLTKQEQRDLLEVVSYHGDELDKALISLMLHYGPRASEVGLIKRSDVNFQEDTIRLRRKKGGVDNVLPLLSQVKASLLDYLATREDTIDRLFVNNRGGPLSRFAVWRRLQKFGRLADLPEDKRHPHVLRHTAGVNALEAGMSIYDVKDLLGHKTVSSTEVYARVTDGRRREAFKILQDHVDVNVGRQEDENSE